MPHFQDSPERAALIERAYDRCTIYLHRIPSTKFLFAACIKPDGIVLCTSYAQRVEGEFVMEVANEYCRQELKSVASVLFNETPNDELVDLINS